MSMHYACRWLAAVAAGLLCAGCSWFHGDSNAPEVKLVLDPDYQPAIGGGFHWKVVVPPDYPEGSGSLTLYAGDQVVGGSQGGLPSDLYVGWLDWESLKFYYPEQTFPADLVAVRMIMGFPDTPNGSASGWLETAEGEIVVHAKDITFSRDGQTAALLEFNVDAARFNGKPRGDGKMQLRETPDASVFQAPRALSVKYSEKPVSVESWKFQELKPAGSTDTTTVIPAPAGTATPVELTPVEPAPAPTAPATN